MSSTHISTHLEPGAEVDGRFINADLALLTIETKDASTIRLVFPGRHGRAKQAALLRLIAQAAESLAQEFDAKAEVAA